MKIENLITQELVKNASIRRYNSGEQYEFTNEQLDKAVADIVKLLAAPAVSKSKDVEREALLVAFYEWRNGEVLDDKLEIETFLKEYDSNQ